MIDTDFSYAKEKKNRIVLKNVIILQFKIVEN